MTKDAFTVGRIVENEDGSADVELKDISPEFMQLIIQVGMIKILEDSLENEKKANRLPSLFKPVDK
jgi:hypothetical protein